MRGPKTKTGTSEGYDLVYIRVRIARATVSPLETTIVDGAVCDFHCALNMRLEYLRSNRIACRFAPRKPVVPLQVDMV